METIPEQGYAQLSSSTAVSPRSGTVSQKQGNRREALSVAERPLKIRLQVLGDAHPETVTTRTLYALLAQEQERVKEDAASEQRAQGKP